MQVHEPPTWRRVAVALQDLLRRTGFELRRYRDPAARRVALLGEHGIKTLVDVGANRGQYASATREAGYGGAIVSLEPLRPAYRNLAARVSSDPNWTCLNVALGDEHHQRTMTVTANSASSSLLAIRQRHLDASPGSDPVDTEVVQVTRLASLASTWFQCDSIWLKLDVQGYEDRVLAGAAEILPFIRVIEVELSLVPLYDEQLLACDMTRLLAGLDFEFLEALPGFYDSASGALLQLDATFVRSLKS